MWSERSHRSSSLFRIIRETQPHVLQTWLYYGDLMGQLVGKVSKVPVIVWNIRRSFVKVIKDYFRHLSSARWSNCRPSWMSS